MFCRLMDLVNSLWLYTMGMLGKPYRQLKFRLNSNKFLRFSFLFPLPKTIPQNRVLKDTLTIILHVARF